MTALPTKAPTLTDGVVTLRAHRPDDVDAVFEQCQDPEMQRWTTIPVPYERGHADFFVSESMPLGWQNPSGTKGFAIEAIDDGQPRFAGTIDVRPDGQAGVEIGFGLGAWARGHGVGSRAVRLAVGWAFEAMPIDVALWRAAVGNWPSRRLAWACGFRIEGPVRALLEARGRRQDAWTGSLRRDEPMTPSRPWLVAPRVEGRRVVLRPWRDEDVPRVVEACSDPVSRRWLPELPSPYGPEEAAAYLLSQRTLLAEGGGVCWSLADPADDRCVGALAIFKLDRAGHEAEIGYWTHPDARGQGVMTEAVQLAVRHAVVPAEDGGLGLPRLGLRAATGNLASRRVAERAGFRPIGVERQVDPQPDGTTDDLLSCDLLADEVIAD
jgi:RimJ/RimL family protein N-acetyltransferase